MYTELANAVGFSQRLTRLLNFARAKWIPRVSPKTGTDRNMIINLAFRVSAAHTWTGIPAVLIEARQVTVAVLVHEALRLAAIHVRVADVRRDTLAFRDAFF